MTVVTYLLLYRCVVPTTRALTLCGKWQGSVTVTFQELGVSFLLSPNQACPIE